MDSAKSFTLPLYASGNIPNRRESGEQEVRLRDQILLVSKVQVPDITVYLPPPDKATGKAVIICPGGGYQVLAYDWEGTEIAQRWVLEGIAAIILKYRLPSSLSQITPLKSPLLDAKRAMRLVRQRASEWHIDPSRIGIMGFSAGGHLASCLSNAHDSGQPHSDDPVERQSCRADFTILVYPVISFVTVNPGSSSREALLGSQPDPALVKKFSSELQVSAKTPPTFLVHAADDEVVSCDHSLLYFQALQTFGVAAALNIFPYGKHGFSLADSDPYLKSWTRLSLDWLNALYASEPRHDVVTESNRQGTTS